MEYDISLCTHPLPMVRIVSMFPMCGQKSVDGRLEESTHLGWSLEQEVFFIDGDTSLWHIDGYHKLVRWRLVIHRGIAAS